MRRTIVTALFAAAVFLPQAAFFSSPAYSEALVTEEQDGEDAEPSFQAFDFDLLVSAGFGGFLYPHVEPGLDVGIVPLGDELVLSVGGGVDFGWCALCGLIDLASDLDVSGSYWGPRFRANLHFGTLFGLLEPRYEKFAIDPYLGIWGGPTIYTFKLGVDGDTVTSKQATAIVGPAAGLRLSTANNTLLLFAEYRWGAEVGFTTVTVENDSGTTYEATEESVSGSGNDFIVGVGIRI